MLADQKVLNTLRLGEKVIASQYAIDDADLTSIWSKAANDSKFFRRIRDEGATVTVHKMHEVACWLSFYWPKSVGWPADGWWRPTMDEACAFMDTLPLSRHIVKMRIPRPVRPAAISRKAAKKGARARRQMETARARAV